MVRNLHHEFEIKDKKVHGGKMCEILDKTTFVDVVKKFFPTKTERDIKVKHTTAKMKSQLRIWRKHLA